MPEVEIWFFLSIHAYIVESRIYYLTNWKLRAEQRLHRGKYQSRQHGDEDKSSGDRHPRWFAEKLFGLFDRSSIQVSELERQERVCGSTPHRLHESE